MGVTLYFKLKEGTEAQRHKGTKGETSHKKNGTSYNKIKVFKKKIFPIILALFLFQSSLIWGEVLGKGRSKNFFKKKEKKREEIEEIPDHNPSLAKDEEGNLYLVWEHGNELWWASNEGKGEGKGWDNYGKIPEAEGTRPVMVYVHRLFEEDISERLFCTWETISSPKKIMSSLGKLSKGKIIWSKPKALTFDDHDDYGLALAVDKEDRPIILWLQQASVREDDSDLYYKMLTSEDLPSDNEGSSSDSEAPPSGSEDLPSDSEDDPSDSDDEPIEWWNPSVITQQELVPPCAVGGLYTCFDRVFGGAEFIIPRTIPLLGGVRGFELSGSICGEPGFDPVTSRDSAIFYPTVYANLSLSLIHGKHVESQTTLFAFDDSILAANAGQVEEIVQKDTKAFGWCYKLNFLSLPIPLAPCFVPIGTTRIGARFQTGAQLGFIRKPGHQGIWAKNDLLSHNLFKDESPDSLLQKIFLYYLPDEIDLLVEVAMGGVGKISCFRGGITGEIFAVGGQVRKYIFTPSPSFEYFAVPYVTFGGFVKASGDWNGISLVFDNTVILDNDLYVSPHGDANAPLNDPNNPIIDPNHSLHTMFVNDANIPLNYSHNPQSASNAATPFTIVDPLQNIIVNNTQVPFNFAKTSSLDPNHPLKTIIAESGKDRLLQRTFGLLEDNVSLFEELEFVKKPFQGKGSVYEGKPVLSDIGNDIYQDGLPSVAKSKSGEIILAWIKDFASSCLGTKVFSSHYEGDKWSKPVEITPDINFSKDAVVVFDSNGIPMIVWSSASNHGLDYEKSTVAEILEAIEKADLMYSHRINGIWTAPKTLAKLLGKDEQICLAAGPAGEITAAWINSTKRGSSLYSSFWDGKIWSKPRLITRAALAEPPKVIYQSEKPLVVWSQDKDGNLRTFDDWCLFSSCRDGLAWSYPRPFLRRVKE